MYIYTRNPQPSTLNPQPSTLNPQPSTLNPQPSTLNPQPSTLKSQLSTLNPQAQTDSERQDAFDRRGPDCAQLHYHPLHSRQTPRLWYNLEMILVDQPCAMGV